MTHYIVHEYRDQGVHTELKCEEPPDADCRQTPRYDKCDCELYAIERAADGTAFHRAETYGGADVFHWMNPGGECNVALWINESGVPEELTPRDTTYTAAKVPVSVSWTGDDWEWEPAANGATVDVDRLASALFEDECGETLQQHESWCRLDDCRLRDLVTRDAQRYADILTGNEE